VRIDVDAPIDLTTPEHDGVVTITGGSGFAGLLLESLDSPAAVLIGRYPEQPSGTGGAARMFVWGRASSGAACDRCSLPAGLYSLTFIVGERARPASTDDVARIELTLSSQPSGRRTVTSADAEAREIHQSAFSRSRPDEPFIAGVSGFGAIDYVGPREPEHGLAVTRHSVSFSGRTVGPALSEAEFCLEDDRGTSCEQQSVLLGGAAFLQEGVRTYAAAVEGPVTTSVEFTSAGDIDYTVSLAALFVPLLQP
jgi:hypothetical protein